MNENDPANHCDDCGGLLSGKNYTCPTCEHEAWADAEWSRMLGEARAEYDIKKQALADRIEQDECPHDETDHYICLDCGKDCLNDEIERAEFRTDCNADR